jgi:hypothetical protein
MTLTLVQEDIDPEIGECYLVYEAVVEETKRY